MNKNDASRISYKAKIEWYKERFSDISSGKIPPEGFADDREKAFIDSKSTPDELISIFSDLKKKSIKLGGKIDELSAGLRIPVDIERNPLIADAVKKMDSKSKGEYISYELYLKLLEQERSVLDSINSKDLIENTPSDYSSTSLFINSKISSGLSSSSETSSTQDTIKRYVNLYLNDALLWDEDNTDLRRVLSFVDSALNEFSDIVYIPWTTKRDISREEVNIGSLGEFWEYFSSGYNKSSELLDQDKGLEPIGLDRKIHDISKRYIGNVNTFFNKVDSIFDMNYAADLMCCFFRWSGSLDVKTLKALSSMMKLLSNGFSIDIGGILNNLKDILWNTFTRFVTSQLVNMVQQVLQRLVDPIKKWVNDPDPRWKKVFVCTPIDELINQYILSAVAYAENLLLELIKNWYKSNELKALDFDLKATLWGEQKGMGNLIKMLDLVISSLENSAICGTESSPTGEEIQKLMSSYGLGPKKQYKYPGEEKPNSYNSFIPEDAEVTSEDSIGGSFTTKFDTNITTSRSDVLNLERCLSIISPDEVLKVTDWLEGTKSKPQES